MFPSHWLHNLLSRTASRKDRLCQAPKQRRVCLTLESLEDRITPSHAAHPQPAVNPFSPTANQQMAIENAFAVQKATANYVNQIFNALTHSAGGHAGSSTSTSPGQNSLDAALAAWSQLLAAISHELSSANSNFQSNPGSLLALQLQQQMGQNSTPSPTGTSVTALAT